MLGLAKQPSIRIFQASTSEIYDDPLVHPQPEEYWGNVNPIGIRSCYDEGKRCAETLFFDYWRQWRRVEVGLIRCVAVKARMGLSAVAKVEIPTSRASRLSESIE